MAVETSRLGLGLAAVARPAYITSGRDRDLGPHRTVAELEQRTWSVLDAAVAAGIGYVDVARSYGRAEEFLASWLMARPEARVEVGSKWGYRYVGGWRTDAETHEVKDHSVAAFREQREQTLALLGARLGTYLVHSATLDTGVLADAAVHRELAGLRDSGVAVGISTSGPEQATALRRAFEVEVDGMPLFSCVQSTWNVLDPSAAPALSEAAAAGIRVVVKEALANGRLVAAGSEPAADVLCRLGDELGMPADAVALSAALAQPWASTVLSGAVTPEQVASNARSAGVALPAAALAELSQLAEDPRDYWAARSRRAWT